MYWDMELLRDYIFLFGSCIVVFLRKVGFSGLIMLRLLFIKIS